MHCSMLWDFSLIVLELHPIVIQMLDLNQSVKSSGCSFFKYSHVGSAFVWGQIYRSFFIPCQNDDDIWKFSWLFLRLWHQILDPNLNSNVVIMTQSTSLEVCAWLLIWFRSKMSAKTSGTTASAVGSFVNLYLNLTQGVRKIVYIAPFFVC